MTTRGSTPHTCAYERGSAEGEQRLRDTLNTDFPPESESTVFHPPVQPALHRPLDRDLLGTPLARQFLFQPIVYLSSGHPPEPADSPSPASLTILRAMVLGVGLPSPSSPHLRSVEVKSRTEYAKSASRSTIRRSPSRHSRDFFYLSKSTNRTNASHSLSSGLAWYRPRKLNRFC